MPSSHALLAGRGPFALRVLHVDMHDAVGDFVEFIGIRGARVFEVENIARIPDDAERGGRRQMLEKLARLAAGGDDATRFVFGVSTITPASFAIWISRGKREAARSRSLLVAGWLRRRKAKTRTTWVPVAAASTERSRCADGRRRRGIEEERTENRRRDPGDHEARVVAARADFADLRRREIAKRFAPKAAQLDALETKVAGKLDDFIDLLRDLVG